MKLLRVADEAALLLGSRTKRLVVADLHLGLFIDDRIVVERLRRLVDRVGADEVIVAGDVKHDIGMRIKERRAVEELAKAVGVPLLVVKGNHDGGIDDVVETTSSRGIRFGKIGIIHGHALPGDDVLQADIIILGHAHPAILIRDKVGGVKERVWLEGKAEFDGREVEVIVMPAFNDLCASTAVNVEKPAGVIFRRWDYRKAEAMLLDGTLLGRVEML
ncbi:metallophosphoesterase family protein [Archaeoglobus veneficus]|uniref:Phosphoesterase n=1 Tax=Archaeoglobus veneficus (strain DSM 11195 / SNP6) TaxID=693661 RepID=F2KQI0_ARCVS|nr:metallophosphoesterase family protein [Archaeoglobus veneficus]AEA47713.1 phosphoesterase [Archaeoglobus veneficus SNP6]